MQRFIVVLGALLLAGLGFSFAAGSSILNYSSTVDGNDVKIFWISDSDGGNVGIKVQNPETDERLDIGTAKISDQTFVYTKQRDGAQKIWMVTDDGGEDIQFTVQGFPTATRTVIPVVPKAGPSGKTVAIILVALAIFGGYIYIKKRADI